MCLHFLVLVTLALTWTSVVPGTLSLVIPSGTSNISPRAPSKRYTLSDLEHEIPGAQKHYEGSPETPESVNFYLGKDKKSVRKVQGWKGIPALLAWEITDLSHSPITIPTIPLTKEKVTVVVTSYVVPPANHVKYPARAASLDHSFINDGATAYPVLNVAPVEPVEWEPGTAVWAHILHTLQVVAQDDPSKVRAEHLQLVLFIAWANRGHSGMLYYKKDSNNRPCAYVMFSKDRQKNFTQKDHETFKAVVEPGIDYSLEAFRSTPQGVIVSGMN